MASVAVKEYLIRFNPASMVDAGDEPVQGTTQDQFMVVAIGTLLCCERNEFGRFEAKHFASQLENARLWDNISLVEYRGDLLLVFRYFSDENSKNWHKTKHFDVHKLDFETKEWIEMDDLGDCSLFIDADNSAMALAHWKLKIVKGTAFTLLKNIGTSGADI
ncbi:hypothetical protein LOK49_LG15G02337 [Camellia lanceoleosa]|uniref:Uncharacterized protein n=1 Tax=Camellia lanceoleosa TaxID=1840588 RepID=A0ACC0F1N6_9ERIC|nr:hypothetical protein LOK49_LG15G02337 [Camellia lanceoleosa]